MNLGVPPGRLKHHVFAREAVCGHPWCPLHYTRAVMKVRALSEPPNALTCPWTRVGSCVSALTALRAVAPRLPLTPWGRCTQVVHAGMYAVCYL